MTAARRRHARCPRRLRPGPPVQVPPPAPSCPAQLPQQTPSGGQPPHLRLPLSPAADHPPAPGLRPVSRGAIAHLLGNKVSCVICPGGVKARGGGGRGEGWRAWELAAAGPGTPDQAMDRGAARARTAWLYSIRPSSCPPPTHPPTHAPTHPPTNLAGAGVYYCRAGGI